MKPVIGKIAPPTFGFAAGVLYKSPEDRGKVAKSIVLMSNWAGKLSSNYHKQEPMKLASLSCNFFEKYKWESREYYEILLPTLAGGLTWDANQEELELIVGRIHEAYSKYGAFEGSSEKVIEGSF